LNARGFTLIELMTSVAIIAIMAALSVGGLAPTIRRVSMQQGATDVAAGLARGRALARATNRCVRLDVVNGLASPLISTLPTLAGVVAGSALRMTRWSDADCEDATAATYAGVQYVAAVSLPSDVTIAFHAAGSNPVVWRGNGRVLGAVGPTQLDLVSSQDASIATSVVIAPNGPICIFPTSAIGACP
jgi:prepilin-type N-terminal cleavage/methylation domain-containing protein